MKEKESTSMTSAASLTKFSTFQPTALLKLIMSDGFQQGTVKFRDTPLALPSGQIWPESLEHKSIMYPMMHFHTKLFPPPAVLHSQPSTYYKHLRSSYKTTCAAGVQASKMMPVMRDFSFSLLPLLIKCE